MPVDRPDELGGDGPPTGVDPADGAGDDRRQPGGERHGGGEHDPDRQRRPAQFGQRQALVGEQPPGGLVVTVGDLVAEFAHDQGDPLETVVGDHRSLEMDAANGVGGRPADDRGQVGQRTGFTPGDDQFRPAVGLVGDPAELRELVDTGEVEIERGEVSDHVVALDVVDDDVAREGQLDQAGELERLGLGPPATDEQRIDRSAAGAGGEAELERSPGRRFGGERSDEGEALRERSGGEAGQWSGRAAQLGDPGEARVGELADRDRPTAGGEGGRRAHRAKA